MINKVLSNLHLTIGVTLLFLSFGAYSQQGFNGIRYQAILRDASGNVVSSQQVDLRFTIYQPSDRSNEFRETHSNVSTNVMGLINLTIGSQNTNDFQAIDWGRNNAEPYFIKIELSDNGGSTFLPFSESQLLSVPYAMYAKDVENVDDADANPTNEIQDLQLSGDLLEITNNAAPTIIDLSKYLDNTDAQVLAYGTDDTLRLTNGGAVYLGFFDLSGQLSAVEAKVRADSIFLSNRIDGVASDLSNRITNDSIRLNALSNGVNSRIVNDSIRLNGIEDSVSDIETRVTNDSLRLNGVVNNISGFNTRITNDSIRLNAIENDFDSRIVDDSLRLNGALLSLTTRIENDSLKLRSDSTDLHNALIDTARDIRAYIDSRPTKGIDSVLANGNDAADQLLNNLGELRIGTGTKEGNAATIVDSNNATSGYEQGLKVRSQGTNTNVATQSAIYGEINGSNGENIAVDGTSSGNSSGTNTGTGGYARNGDFNRGVHAVADSGRIVVGMQATASKGKSQNIGAIGTATNGDTLNLGVAGEASGGGQRNTGVRGFAQGTGVVNEGVSGIVQGNGSDNTGVRGSATGSSTSNQGVEGSVTGTSSTAGYRGVFGQANSTGAWNEGVSGFSIGTSTTNNTGVYGQSQNSTGTNIGTYGVAVSPTTGSNYGSQGVARYGGAVTMGVRGSARGNSSSNLVYGVYGEVDSAGNIKRGVVGNLIGPVDGNDAAIYGIAQGQGTNTAVYGRANNTNNLSDTNIALVGQAANALVNISGWFKEGNVFIDDTLFLREGAQQDYVLTAVGSDGKAEWRPAQSDNDGDSTNEIITSFTLSNDTLSIVESGDTNRVVFSGFVDTAAFNVYKTLAAQNLMDSVNVLRAEMLADTSRIFSLEQAVASGAYKDSSASNELIDTTYFENDIAFIVEAGDTNAIDLSSLNASASLSQIQDSLAGAYDSLLVDSILIAANIDSIISNRTTILNHIAVMQDSSATNELIDTTYFENNTAYIVEAGDTNEIDLSSLNASASLKQTQDSLAGAYDSLLVDSILIAANIDSIISNRTTILNHIAAMQDSSATNETLTDANMIGDSLRLIESGDTSYVDLTQFNSTTNISGLIAKDSAFSDSLNNIYGYHDTLALDVELNFDDIADLEIDLSNVQDSLLDVYDSLRLLSLRVDSANSNLIDSAAAIRADMLSAGGLQDLDSVLSVGNNAGGDSIVNLGRLGIGTSNPDHNLTVDVTDSVGVGVFVDADTKNNGVTTGLYSAVDGGAVGSLQKRAGEFSAINTAEINIGVLSSAYGATENYAAYFDTGNVYIGDTLYYPLAPVDGYVLTTDGNGKATWQAAAASYSTQGIDSVLFVNDDANEEGIFNLSQVGIGVLSTDYAMELDVFDSAAVVTTLDGGSKLDGTIEGMNMDVSGGGGSVESYGIRVSNSSNGDETVGLETDVSGASLFNTGVKSQASSSSVSFATAYEGHATGTGSNTVFEGYATSVASDEAVGVDLNIDGSGENYGIYSRATGGTENWSGYFDTGNVYIGDTLYYPLAPVNGYVLTVDGNGKATWQPAASTYTTKGIDSVLAAGSDANNDSLYNLRMLGIGTSTPSASLDIQTSDEFSVSIINNGSSANDKKGVFSTLSGTGSGDNFGLYGGASNSSGTNYGVYGQATGTQGTKYAIYGTTTGSNAWSGYFNQGNVYINDNLGIGVLNPVRRLDVGGDLDVDSLFTDSLYARLAHIDSLRIANSYSLPNADGDNGDVLTSDGFGNVRWEPAASVSVGDTTQIADADNDTKVSVSTTNNNIDFIQRDTTFWRMNNRTLEALNSGNSVFIGEEAGINDDLSNNLNVFIGYRAGRNNSLAGGNVFIGSDAGRSNTTGGVNVFVGRLSGTSNTTGQSNVFTGYYTGNSNTIGNYNVFNGYGSGRFNTTGSHNVFTGNEAGHSNKTGINNVYTGSQAGRNIQTGSNNVFTGYGAGRESRSGEDNVFTGYEAGWRNLGDNNIAIGSSANFNNLSGNNNVIVGFEAGKGYGATSHTKSGAIYIGYRAGQNDTTDNKLYIENSNSSTPLIYGDFAADSLVVNGQLTVDSARDGSGYVLPGKDGSIGQILTTDGNGNATWQNGSGGDTLSFIQDSDGNTKVQTESIGDQIVFTTSGIDRWKFNKMSLEPMNNVENVLIGEGAGQFMDTTADRNGVALGNFALNQNSTGVRNTALGNGAMRLNSTGGHNTAIGYQSARANNGGFNTSIGVYSMWKSTGAGNNVAIGYQSLYNNLTGGGNVTLGYQAGFNELGSDKLYIANTSTSTPLIYGEFDNDSLRFNGAVRIADELYVDSANATQGYVLTADANGAAKWQTPSNVIDTLSILQDGNKDTKIQLEKFTNEDIIRFDMGGAEVFRFGKNGQLQVFNGNKGVYLGNQAGNKITSGSNNTLIGEEAGANITTAGNNTFIGYQSGKTSNGDLNTALGYLTGSTLSTGKQNALLGASSGAGLKDGSNNTFIGFNSGRVNSSGVENVFLGSAAGETATGSKNIFIGFEAGKSETGDNKLYINNKAGTPLIFGDFANDSLRFNGDVTIRDGLYLPFGSPTSGQVLTSDANGKATWQTPSVGTQNDSTRIHFTNGSGAETAVDVNSTSNNIDFVQKDTTFWRMNRATLEALSTGNSVFIGNGSGLNDDYTSNRNTFLGDSSGLTNTTGFDNVFLGSKTGYSNSNGADNTFVGSGSGSSNTTGYDNVFLGSSTGTSNTSGHENVFIGFRSGDNNVSGRGNVFLGYNSGRNETGSDKLYISNSQTNNPLIYGEFDNDSLRFFANVRVVGDLYIDSLNAGSGKVLTSDANGKAMWQNAASSSPWTESVDSVYVLNKRVGIGIPTPQSLLHVASNTDSIGIQTTLNPSTNNRIIGLQSGVVGVGTGDKFGGLFTTTGSGGDANYGIHSTASNAQINYGVLGTGTALSGTDTAYGVYGRGIGTSGTTYGVFGTATGLGTNYAGFFDEGNVQINDTLILPDGASDGAVLTSDANGKATWQTISDTLTCPTGMEKVNDDFCIDKTERTAAIWFVADSICVDSGYTLASYGDWYGAATQAAASNITLSNMENNWEWTSNISQNNVMVVGDPTGGLGRRQRAFRDPENDTATYRCVYRN